MGVPSKITCIKLRAYGRVSALAPKKVSISSRKIKDRIPKKREFVIQSISVCDKISVAPFISFCPRRIEARVDPPAETSVQKATTRFISGKLIASPAIAIGPTPCPMKILSMML